LSKTTCAVHAMLCGFAVSQLCQWFDFARRTEPCEARVFCSHCHGPLYFNSVRTRFSFYQSENGCGAKRCPWGLRTSRQAVSHDGDTASQLSWFSALRSTAREHEAPQSRAMQVVKRQVHNPRSGSSPGQRYRRTTPSDRLHSVLDRGREVQAATSCRASFLSESNRK
jgi:hypothetical protein